MNQLKFCFQCFSKNHIIKKKKTVFFELTSFSSVAKDPVVIAFFRNCIIFNGGV